MSALKRIVTWLGIMAGLTLLAIGIWWVVWDHSQSTESLKWLQFIQTVGTFLLPPILCTALWDTNHRPFAWLKMDKGAHWSVWLLAVGIMIAAIPGINLLADLNAQVSLPDCLAPLERWMKEQEENAAVLTQRFLQADNIGQLIVNIGLLALLPALAEELSFRGTLQQVLTKSQEPRAKSAAVWITAFIFSAIHFQFYGFVPRMLLGAIFGYAFVWTGSLWVPILMHFTNNGLAVIAYYIEHSAFSLEPSDTNIADTIGAGDTWWLGVVSILLTSLGLLIFYRRTRTR